MSFSNPNGTRGARQPGGLMRWMNKVMTPLVRRTGGRLGRQDVLVLTTVGRRTGAERSTPLSWFPGEDGSWLVVASAAGAAQNPAWYYNVAAAPRSVRIEVAGETIPVTAEQVDGDDRDRVWPQIKAASAQFAGYESKTDRQLPVIRLTRREA